MIFDSLRNWQRYTLNPDLRTALEYLQSSDFARMDDGRYNLGGDDLYAMVSRYKTRTPEAAIWESHRRYIDVQFVVQGTERLGYIPLERGPEVKTPYDAGRDVIFTSRAKIPCASPPASSPSSGRRTPTRQAWRRIWRLRARS